MFPGRWDVSGGHVDVGESYSEAAAREAFEELALKVQVEEIKSQTELAKTELNNEAKVLIEQMKQNGKAESDMAKIAADAQQRISDLADEATMQVEQSIEMIPDVDDAQSMIQKTAGPVVMDDTVEEVDFPTDDTVDEIPFEEEL